PWPRPAAVRSPRREGAPRGRRQRRPGQVLGRYQYSHPVYTPAGVAAQARHADISGQRRSYFCGAHWRYGFHEDGVVSGLSVLAQVDKALDHG
ncbi:MAG: hypothetical protein ACO3WK_03955, partial [Steroidobacteraceae bacterium]